MHAENVLCVTSLHGGHLPGLCIWPSPKLSVTDRLEITAPSLGTCCLH